MTDTGQRLVNAATEARNMASLVAENAELREQVRVLREAVRPMVAARIMVSEAYSWREAQAFYAAQDTLSSAYEATEPKE